MSRFVLTAQLQLQAPSNVRQVVNQIQSQLAGVNVPINVQSATSAIRQINQIKAATNDATSAAERMGTAFGVSLKRFASFSIATRAVGLFTSGLAGAIKDAIAFERELIKVAQVSNQSISSLKGLTSTITELATSLGVESKSLLEVSTILKQAGLSANDTSIALRTLAKAALAPNFDSITETTEGAIAILAQFGLGVQSLEGQLSSIDAVAGAFAVEASDLIDVIRRTGGVFKSSGGDLNELIALFTSVRATTRESAESIGTGLRTIFTRIQRPKTIEFLKQFGVELVDLEGKFVGPFEAVKRLSAALNGLGEGDLTFIRVAEELGGFRQIGKVLPLLQQFSMAQEALNVAQNAGNGLTQNAVTAQQALAIRITKVKEEFLAFVRGLTESKGFQIFVNTALNLASAFIKIGEALTPVIPLLTAMMAINISRGIGSFLTSIPRGVASNRLSGGGRVLGFNSGGIVPGVGNRDSVPAMLTPGEVVVNKTAAQKYGAGNIDNLNRGGRVQKFWSGGISRLGGNIGTLNVQDPTGKNIGIANDKYSIKTDKKPIVISRIQKDQNRKTNFVDAIYEGQNYTDIDVSGGKEPWRRFEIIAQVVTGSSWANDRDKTYPIDLAKSGHLFEVKYKEAPEPDQNMAAKSLRHHFIARNIGFRSGSPKNTIVKLTTPPNNITGNLTPDTDNLTSTDDITQLYPSFRVRKEDVRNESISSSIERRKTDFRNYQGRRNRASLYAIRPMKRDLENAANTDSDTLDISKGSYTSFTPEAQRLNIGGLVQRFEEGGVAQRRVGIIDSDVLRDKKNAARVAEGMKLLDAKSEADYAIKLSKLAGESRQAGSLSRFSVMAGAAANRKSSVATGRGAKDDATLRKTTRKQILHPDDLKDVDQVMSLTTTLKDSKLDYMGMADRIYSKDSSTEDEQKLVKLFERQRNLQKDPTLYGRETGTTEGLNPDYGLQTASLISQFGSTEDRTNRGKVMTLGEKTDQEGNPRFQIRRKRFEELPELANAKGQFPGAAAMITRGHAETAVGTLLAKVREKYPDATHKDLLFALAPDLSLSGGSQGREHGSRYGEYPAAFRRDLIKLALPEMMISSANSPSQTGINSRIAEIEKGATGRRRFAVMEKDAPVVISKAENENPEGVMERYREAGLKPYNIARSSDVKGKSISGTAARQAVVDKDYDTLDLAVLPQVGSAIKANQPQLRNRRMMVPLVQQALDIFTQANTSKVNQQVDEILKNASGGPFTRMTPKFKESHPNLVKQIQQLRSSRDIFEREAFLDPAHELIRIISDRYPDIYGLDVSRKEPVDIPVNEDSIKQHIIDASKSSSYFRPGLSFNGDGIQLSPTLQKVKDAVDKEVKSEVVAEPKVEKEIVAPDSRSEIFKILSREEAAEAAGVDRFKAYDIMGIRKELTPEQQKVKDAIKAAYVKKVKRQGASAKAQTTKLREKGLEFGAAGLFGKAFAAKNIKIESDKLSSPRMVRVNSGVMDQVTATRLSTTMSQGVSDIISQGTNIVRAGQSKSPPTQNPLQGLNTNTNATIQGGLIEQIIQQLGGPGAVKGKGFDFPEGLQGAAKYFNIDPSIPTDVKRTLSGPSTIKDNIVTYLKNVMGYNSGGTVQSFMAGGVATKTRKSKAIFGTGETEFPSRISKKYAEEQKTADEFAKSKLAWDKNPKDERIMVDDDKVKESFQQPFDRERFAASFKEKISRDSLFARMSDFAKFVGLPQEDLTAALPLQLDFGASKRGGGLGMFAAAQFERGATGIRPYEGYDISKSGYGEKQKQEAYGLEKLIAAKEKEIAKIRKTPTETFDDGSFSFDSDAYSKANDELAELKNKSFKLKDLKRDAEKAALSEQTATSSSTGRGTISFAPSMGYSSDTKNSTLYHEMTHQLFQGLRTKSAESFAKYRDRVSSLFSGDNDDLADAFDSLTATTAGGGYTSADVVYGRSYKSNNLSQILSSYYRQNLDSSRGATPIPQDITKTLASLSTQSTAAKRAKEYRPINPEVNEALLKGGSQFGMTQEKIDRMEDNGKEEFLTTLIEKAPQLDQNLQGILDSTLTELLSGAGIQRQKFATGGKAFRGVDLDRDFMKNPIPSHFNDKVVSKKLGPEVYDLEKNSGLSSFEFDETKRLGDAAGDTIEQFKKRLAERVQAKKQRSQIKINSSDMAQQLMPTAKTSTPKQIELGKALQDTSNDIGYRPSDLERIAQARADVSNATRYAVGGVAEAGKKEDKQYGQISITEDAGMISVGYQKGDNRQGYATGYKMRDNLYYVGLSKATKGYGPRLYDVLMEAVTEKGAMLTSDRSSVSEDAKRVWEYYFKNRGDVKKTPLKPSDWTVNSELIDPKLYGKKETWPPATDPAWTLQTGYSKSPRLITDTNEVIRKRFGGRLGFETGGTVPALVSNGEAYVPPAMAKKIGYGKLNRMNQADRNGMSRFSDGGISVFKGPGTGTSDSIPANLPVGSFIIREKATKALGLNRGGAVAIRQKFATGGVAQLIPPLPPSPLKKPDPTTQVKAVYQDKEMDAIKKKWPIGTKIASGEWKLPGHKSIGVGQFAGDHKALTDFGGSGWKMRVDPKTDNDNILIADWFGKNKSLFSGYKIATNTDKPVWSAYVSRGTGPEIQKAAQKAQSDLGQFITLNQAYDTTDTMIPGTGISGRFEIRGDERSGTPRAKEIVDTINERRKATTKYRNFYLLYKQSPGFQQGFPSSTSGDRGVPGTHYYQWLLGQKKLAIQGKNVDRAKEFEAAQNEEIKLIESVLKEKTPEYSFNSQQSSSTSPKTRLAPPPPPPPKKFAGGGLVSLYHGSNTGVNDNVLKSFKEKGALSNIATGYGQGAGFYVYSGKEKAKQQAMMRVKKGLGSFTVVSGDTEGKPMVVSFKELLDPATWDLDYELNKGPIVEWLVKNYDQLKDKLVPTENLTGIKNIVTQDKSKGIMSSGIRVQEGDQTMVSDTGEEMVVKGGARKTIYSGTDSDIREGQLVGQIMARLKAQDPKTVGDFENTFFKSPALASGEWDDLALKYVGSSSLKPTNIETFANGGSVPALVSNGEAYVPPKAAKRIGYGTLNRMNQADRNGMGRFSSGGGISVFKGQGSGTSDSIPANLPVGSFIIRAKATKALGLNKGGRVQKFADGGTPIQQRVSELYDQREALKERAKTATGTESTQITKQMQDIEKEMEKLETAYKKLTDIIASSTKRESNAQKALDKANQDLIAKLQTKTFGGKRFDELDAASQEAAINSARKGKFKDSTGKDEFASENQRIDISSRVLDRSRLDRDLAQQTLSTRFGGTAPTFDMEARRRGNSPFPYPTPATSSVETAPASTGTASGDSSTPADDSSSKKSMLTFSQAIAGSSAVLNGLIQTVGGVENAFTNGMSSILGSITALSSSFSILEQVTGQQINGISDIAKIPEATSKTFAEFGSKLGSGGEAIGKVLGTMVGYFTIGAAATQLLISAFYGFSTAQAQLDNAIKAGNVELAKTLAVQNARNADIQSAGSYVGGAIVAVGATFVTLLPSIIAAAAAFPVFGTAIAAAGTAVGAFIAPIAIGVLAVTALVGSLFYFNESLRTAAGDMIGGLANGIRDGASGAAKQFGIQIDDSATRDALAEARAGTEASKSRSDTLGVENQKKQELSLIQLSQDKISGKEAFDPFKDQAKEILTRQSLRQKEIDTLTNANGDGSRTAEIQKLKDEQIKESNDFQKNIDPITSNIVKRSVSDGETDPAKIFAKLPEELQQIIKNTKGGFDDFVNSTKNIAKDQNELQKRITALTLGFDSMLVSVKAADAANKNFANSLTVGNNPIDNAMATIDAALAGAANKLKVGELDSAVNSVSNVLRGLGASEEDVNRYTNGIKAISQVQADLPSTFENLKTDLSKNNKPVTSQNIIEGFQNQIKDSLPKDLPEETRNRILDSMKDIGDLSDDQRKELEQKFKDGKLDDVREMLGLNDLGTKFNEIAQKAVAPLGDALKNLNNVINQRIEAEKNLISAQRQAIDLSLEGLQLQSKYGGDAVTPEVRRQAALESANVGRRRLGLEDVRGSDPNSLRAGLNQTRLKFSSLEQKRVRQEQAGTGASGPSGVEDEAIRTGLKDAQQDQVKLIRDLISAEEEQLKLTKEKNKLEKDSLESLLAGDIDKFFEQQAAVGATAAIASGNTSAINQFGGQALGGAYQNLQRQKDAGVTELYGQRIAGAGGLLESSAMASLGSRGIQNPRMAQILAGTTQEEEASSRRLREYGGLLGEAGAAGAEMAQMEVARAEMNVEKATINVQSAGGGDQLNNRPQAISRGGIVYASKGQLINFVPKGTDTVPAMLTPGEFVINRGAVNRGDNLSFLRAINNGNYTASAQRLNSNNTSIPSIMKQLSGSPQVIQTQETQKKMVQNERSISNVNFDVQKLSKQLGKFMSGFDGFMESFSDQVGKLGNTEVSHKMGDVNLNINGGQFLQSMADGLKQQLMQDLGQQLQSIKINNVGNIKLGRTSVL